jgi:hypothetical protein
MNKITVLLVAIGLFATTSFTKNNNTHAEVSNIVGLSFKYGNSEMLARCLESEIELIIDGDHVQYQNLPSEKAKLILEAFFKKNPPVSFSYVYQGRNSESFKYSIGNYRSKKNEYMVYMLIKKGKNNQFLINTLQLKKG